MSILNIREPDGSVVKLEYHESLPSTANLARIYAKAGYPDRYVVFAENKVSTDGKSAKTPGVYISCLLRPSFFPSQATFLSSLATVAAVTALEEHTAKKLGIGWISTVYCDGKIIGDVSIEGKLDGNSYEYILVNFSLALNKNDFPARLTDIIKKVFEKDNNSVPMIIGKNIISKFFPLYSNMKNTAKFMDIYKKKFILRGKFIKKIEIDGKKTKYKVLTIEDKNASLLVEDRNGKVVNLSSPKSIILPKKVKLPKEDA